ncbi:hypothetical protein C8F04DRAFT_1332941 [Mycena alexandri]|uniref:TLC domain-containing protein n=1 Tax=Mycena alexandri TaxID=1745969 RepID=A0AAD6WM34_9AGAR|nr:hypothetical protein C8F04DRAFT_1332941 [Mycena alexandri]
MLDVPQAGRAAAALNITTPVFFPAFLTLCAAYPVFAGAFSTARQRAWILTTIASAIMTLASLPFVHDYALALRAGGGVEEVQLRTDAAVAVNRFFQAYLAADMFIGGLYYRAQIGFLTGWVHHAVYLCITEIAIRLAWAHIFCFAACMELPTLLLGLATLLPALRSNALFALTFLATRIVFHIVLMLSYASTPATRVPAGILAMVFPLHAMWFVGCVKGFVKRFKASRNPSKTSTSTIAVSTTIETKTTSARHPLAPDIYPDARSLARHAHIASPQPPPWAVTLRLRRLRARVDGWASSYSQFEPPGWLPTSRAGAWPWIKRAMRHSNTWRPQRPIPMLRAVNVRPRVMVRRMSATLVRALAASVPSREVVLEYVLGESGNARPERELPPASSPPASRGEVEVEVET